jgi:hypothetical protein
MKRAVAGGLFGGGAKTFAAVASTGAAVVSILSFLNGWGLLGAPTVRENVANMGVRWIGIRPAADTARAIHDTLHLAATLTDKNGSQVLNARPTWTTENPQVATVSQDGSVIARGAGATTIIALIGEISARSRIVVQQTVARVQIAGDSAIAMAEGDRRQLEVRAFDKRGYAVPSRPASWAAEAGAVVTVDSTGTVLATDVGRAIVNVTLDGIGAQTLVNVAPAPAAIAMVRGEGQHAAAGSALSERVIVRVVNRRGRPVEGTLVRFRASPGEGVVDPAAVVTDADGRARTAWTLGDRPGRQRLLASVERVDSALTIEAEAEPQPANTRLAALRDTLAGVVGQLPDSVVGIRVTDSSGRAMPDVPVTWTTLDGGAVETLSPRTDSLGESKVRWTLGTRARAQRLRARVAGGVPPVTVTALALPAAPATVTVSRAQKKSTDARSIAIVATVKDTFGNVVPRATVRLMPRSGAISSTTVESDSVGDVAAVWTLATNTRDHILIASVRGLTSSDTLVVRTTAPTATQTTTKQAGRPRRPR